MDFDLVRNVSLYKRVKREFIARYDIQTYTVVRFLAFVDYLHGYTGNCTAARVCEMLDVVSPSRVSRRLYNMWCAGWLKQKKLKSPGAGRPPRAYWLSDKGRKLLAEFELLFSEVERNMF